MEYKEITFRELQKGDTFRYDDSEIKWLVIRKTGSWLWILSDGGSKRVVKLNQFYQGKRTYPYKYGSRRVILILQ